MSYTLFNYIDVWGNKKDGYDVNNQTLEDKNFFIDEKWNDKDIINELFERGFLVTKDMRKIIICHYGEDMEILSKKNNFPLYYLRLN